MRDSVLPSTPQQIGQLKELLVNVYKMNLMTNWIHREIINNNIFSIFVDDSRGNTKL